MSYTVKQVAGMSGVSVRTLHFYDETGLLKPARCGANGYRFYEEPQLLKLQQILFYRELGFALKQIKKVLGRRDFEKIAALESHRKVLLKNLTRTRSLVETIDKTIKHLKGTEKMKSEELFKGFSVPAGGDRFGSGLNMEGTIVNCKVSSKDTGGAMCVLEMTGGWPRHAHPDLDEWIYVIDGEVEIEVAKKHFKLSAGESTFIPRLTTHTWGSGGKVLNVYQPAGKMEEFFQAVQKHKDLPTHAETVERRVTEQQIKSLCELFARFGMDLQGPPLGCE